MASLIDQYSETKNLRWEDVANQLWIDNYRLAKLALCRRPRVAKFSDDIAQVAHYVGLDQDRLAGFIKSVDGVKVEPPKKQKAVVQPPARTYNRGVVWAFAAVLLVLVFLSAFVLFQPEAAAATLIVRRGNVTVLKAANSVSLISSGQAASIAVGKAATVEAGDTIRVGDNSFAQLQLADGSTVELLGNTELQAETLNIGSESYQVRLKLLTGRAVNRVKRLLNPGDIFEVITPSSTVSVRGTVFTVQVISPEITYVSCDEGVVQVSMGDLVVEVRAGEEVTATVGEPLDVQPQPDGQDTGTSPDVGTPTPDLLVTVPTVQGTPTPLVTVVEAGSQPGDDGVGNPVGNPTDPEGTPVPVDDPVTENPPPGQGGIPPGSGGEPPGQGTPPGHQEKETKVKIK